MSDGLSQQIFALLIAFIGGGGLIEVLRRWKSRSDLKAAEATTRQVNSATDANALTSISNAFGELAEHTRRELNELRERVVRLEELNKAAITKIAELESELHAVTADRERIRGERDQAREQVVQQQGEIRQLKQIGASALRVGEGK